MNEAKKITRYKECYIEVRPTDIHGLWWKKDATQEERDKYEIEQYERWAKDFREFLRDHRSQDVQDVIVHRVTEDVCSLCGYAWEVIQDEDGKDCCANCMEVLEAKQ